MQKLDELEEKATDLLHSDMIGSEVLKQISLIAKQTQINMTIPKIQLNHYQMVSIDRLVKIYNNFGDRENYPHWKCR